MNHHATEMRKLLDAWAKHEEDALAQNTVLTHLLRRIVALIGKTELTRADLEQIERAKRYLGVATEKPCHYCDGEAGQHTHGCPVVSPFLIEEGE